MKRLHEDNPSKRIRYLNLIVSRKRSALNHVPAGHLKIYNRGSKSYYSYYSSNDKTVRYLKVHDKNDRELAKALAQRDYDEKILKLALKEKDLLERIVAFYHQGCVDDLFESLNPGRKALVTPIRLSDQKYIEKWLAQTYQKRKTDPDEICFETKRGELVHSKSELMIGDDLYLDEIPYLYEMPVKVTDLFTGRPHTVYPDFTVLNVRTRKTYLWEHLGKCDDPDYVNDNMKKLIEYENAGYRLGDNLIVTFETRAFPLTPDRVKLVINTYFI